MTPVFPALSPIPSPAERRMAVHISPEAERAVRRGHPWLFDGAIARQSFAGAPGDIAVIFDRKRRFLAAGLFDPHSPIRVRILQHGTPATIDGAFFAEKLRAAAAIRAPLMRQPPERATTGYRLVYGENDGLPGLVLDRFDRVAVAKIYSAAWLPHLRDVLSALSEILPLESVVLRMSRAVQKTPSALFGLTDGQTIFGATVDAPVLFRENGLFFEADPVRGQKTGFFLDQRDNRARVETLSKGKSVLNLFSYTGGFSVYAARGGATEVVSVDMSAPALAVAERNFAHNHHCAAVARARHTTIAEDVFAVLARFAAQRRRFDVVIIDPPMFAQKGAQVAGAVVAYKKLTRLGLAVLKPGGTLVQASCSGRVDAATFFAAVTQSAARAGRPLRELARTGHPLDHPVTLAEGAYLKCLFAVAP